MVDNTLPTAVMRAVATIIFKVGMRLNYRPYVDAYS